MKKILVALSGGVDSAVAALRLKEQGYDISCAYIRTWMNEESPFADCPAQQDIEDSTAVAAHLGLDYEVVNLVNEYREHVVEYLVSGYRSGITPNPDIMCNARMKFGIFQDYARDNGFDGIATGHYVRKRSNADGTFDILKGVDSSKDQSYFLSLLEQQQISDALFPVGELEKVAVRELATRHSLPNAAKKDSQGICFLGDTNIKDFLKHYIDDKPGDIVNSEGKKLGRHLGLHRYTTGQRRGIGIPSNTDNRFYVVTRLDMERNELVVDFDDKDAPDLYSSEATLIGMNYINTTVSSKQKLEAKPRYREESKALTFEPFEDDKAHIRFVEPQRALSPGQVLALYDGECLLGGGFFQ